MKLKVEVGKYYRTGRVGGYGKSSFFCQVAYYYVRNIRLDENGEVEECEVDNIVVNDNIEVGCYYTKKLIISKDYSVDYKMFCKIEKEISHLEYKSILDHIICGISGVLGLFRERQGEYEGKIEFGVGSWLSMKDEFNSCIGRIDEDNNGNLVLTKITIQDGMESGDAWNYIECSYDACENLTIPDAVYHSVNNPSELTIDGYMVHSYPKGTFDACIDLVDDCNAICMRESDLVQGINMMRPLYYRIKEGQNLYIQLIKRGETLAGGYGAGNYEMKDISAYVSADGKYKCITLINCDDFITEGFLEKACEPIKAQQFNKAALIFFSLAVNLCYGKGVDSEDSKYYIRSKSENGRRECTLVSIKGRLCISYNRNEKKSSIKFGDAKRIIGKDIVPENAEKIGFHEYTECDFEYKVERFNELFNFLIHK